MKNICVITFLGLLLCWSLLEPVACAGEPAAPVASGIIQTEEVKDAAAEAEQQKISLADVEKSRTLTGNRLYGLAGFWLLIVLAIFLIRYQMRDDERLYKEGYYSKDIEQP